MRRSVTSSAFAICLVALGVPRLSARSTQDVQPPAGFPAIGAPSTITVISLGAQPRKALRLVIANGHREHMTMDTTMAMTMAMGENSMPSMTLPMLRVGADLEVTAVSNTGDMTISTKFTDATWIGEPGTDPSMLAMLNSTTADLKGVSGTSVISNRAVARDVKIDISKISNPQLSQAMGTVQQMLQSLSLPLPEEPVGVGATWEVRVGAKANGLQTFNKYSVQLTEVDDSSCTLKMALDQTAPPQSISNPAMGGATASIDAFNSTGTATTKMQFDALSPTSEMNVNMKMTMSIDMGGNPQQMNMAMSIKSTVAPSAVK